MRLMQATRPVHTFAAEFRYMRPQLASREPPSKDWLQCMQVQVSGILMCFSFRRERDQACSKFSLEPDVGFVFFAYLRYDRQSTSAVLYLGALWCEELSKDDTLPRTKCVCDVTSCNSTERHVRDSSHLFAFARLGNSFSLSQTACSELQDSS